MLEQGPGEAKEGRQGLYRAPPCRLPGAPALLLPPAPAPLLHLPFLHMGTRVSPEVPVAPISIPHNNTDLGSTMEIRYSHHLWLVQGRKDHVAEACSSGGRKGYCKSQVE